MTTAPSREPGALANTNPFGDIQNDVYWPRGIEAVLEYNGYIFNDRRVSDRVVIQKITGLDDPDVRDSREDNPDRDYETPYDAFYGGRTMTLTGYIRAGNYARMRKMWSDFKSAFDSLDELPLYFRWLDWKDEFKESLALNDYYFITGAGVNQTATGLNLCPNGSFEHDSVGPTAAGWSAGNGVVSSTFNGSIGTHAWLLGSGLTQTDNVVMTTGSPVTAGVQYKVTAAFKQVSAAGNDARLQILWLNNGGGTISTDSGSFGPSVGANGTGSLICTATAPAGAVTAKLAMDKGFSTTQYHIDAILFCPTSQVQLYSPLVLSDSPLLYWRLGDTVGAGTVADASGNGRTGTVGSGVTLGGSGLITGDTDTSGSFDGTTNAKITSSYNPFTGNISVCGWSNATTLAGARNLFGGSTGNGPLLQIQTNNDVIWWSDLGAATQTWAAAWPAANTRVFWALTWNNSTKVSELWINGVSQGTRTSANAFNATPGNIVLAGSSASSGFLGPMDEFAVFAGTLSSARITAYYNAGRNYFDGDSSSWVWNGTAGNSVSQTPAPASVAISSTGLLPTIVTQTTFFQNIGPRFLYDDNESIIKFNHATMTASKAGVLFRVRDNNNYLMAVYEHASTRIAFYKVVNGTPTLLDNVTVTLSNATDYWLQAKVVGQSVTYSVWNAYPADSGSGSTLLASKTTDFSADGNASLFTQSKRIGVTWTPNSVADRIKLFEGVALDPGDHFIKCRKVAKIESDEGFLEDDQFKKPFMLTVRASDARYVSRRYAVSPGISASGITALTFPGGGGGFTFPSDGSGLVFGNNIGTVTNFGTAPASPVIRVSGGSVFTNLAILNSTTGQKIVINGVIPATETWEFDCYNRTVKDIISGSDRFDKLGDDTTWIDLASGVNQIAAGADSVSGGTPLITFVFRHSGR